MGQEIHGAWQAVSTGRDRGDRRREVGIAIESTGAEVLDCAQRDASDVLVTDLGPPRRSGVRRSCGASMLVGGQEAQGRWVSCRRQSAALLRAC